MTESLNLTNIPNRTPEIKPFDSSEARENVRGWLAKALFYLLLLIIIGSLISVACCHSLEMREWLTIVFGPLITLLGTVTGFYYGKSQD